MKTAHIYTTRDDDAMAIGFDSAGSGPRQAAATRRREQVRAAGEDKVIDLTAWRAANLKDEFWEKADVGGESGGAGWETDESAVPAPRTRRSHRAMLTAELVSTLSVVAAAVALIVRVLTF